MKQGQTLPPGYQLHEYKIDRTLGAGGFGITYLARDEHLDRLVAIKEYFPNDFASRSADGSVTHYAPAQDATDQYEWGRKSFVDEARTLAKFEHPNVIRVVRYLEENNTAYIVMEFADGEPLSEIIKREGSLPEDRVRSILLSLIDGLGLVHSEGLLHRDIKPQNIIIRPDGAPVLIDFGAARQAIGVKSRSISTIVTPGFAPIEQYSARGNQGPWTDIYALGGIAYSCLTSRVPDEATERIRSDSMPALTQAAIQPVSKQLSDAIAWALRPEEENRPQSVADFKAALIGKGIPETNETVRVKPGKAGSPPLEPIKKPKGRFGLPHVVATVASIGVLGGLAFLIPQIFSLTDNNPDTVPPRTGTEKIAQQQSETAQAEARPAPSKPEKVEPQPAEKPSPRQVSPQEAKDFRIVAQIGTPEAYELFLRKYPDGQYAEEARKRWR